MFRQLALKLELGIPAWLDRSLQWWLTEIRGLLPAGSKGHFTIPRYEHLLEFNGGHLTATDLLSGKQTILPDEASQLAFLHEKYGPRSFLKHLTRPQLRLHIPISKCLVRQLTIPTSSRLQAKQIADLLARTGLPFEPGQVVCAHAVRDSDDGVIAVTSIIVKRDILESQLGILRRAGCVPDTVDVTDADGRAYNVNLLESSAARARLSKSVVPLTLFVALALTLIAIQLNWSKRTDALEALDLEIGKIKANVDSLLRKSAEVNVVADAVISLRRKRAIEPTMVEIWDRLTRAMPDTAWITQLQATKAKVSIAGFASEAAPLVSILDRESLFKGVAFASPVTYDTGAGAERFVIGMDLETADPSELRVGQAARP